MTPEELEQRLRRAVELRKKLRAASKRLMAFGETLLRTREADGAGSR
jgi:hypothetical protein